MQENNSNTGHPLHDKVGVHVSKHKYEVVKKTILDTIRQAGDEGITFLDLFNSVIDQLAGRFEGSIGWYVTTVKLDLEARGLIERITDTTPQRLRLAKSE